MTAVPAALRTKSRAGRGTDAVRCGAVVRAGRRGRRGLRRLPQAPSPGWSRSGISAAAPLWKWHLNPKGNAPGQGKTSRFPQQAALRLFPISILIRTPGISPLKEANTFMQAAEKDGLK